MVQLLISRGAALDDFGLHNMTPLYTACARNHVDVALALCAEEGATAVLHRGLTRATSPRELARPPSYDSILRDMLPDKTR